MKERINHIIGLMENNIDKPNSIKKKNLDVNLRQKPTKLVNPRIYKNNFNKT